MSHMTLLTGPERRRRWDDDVRERILAEAFSPGATVSDVSMSLSNPPSEYKTGSTEIAGEPVSLRHRQKMNDVDPQAWLADVLARIASQPAHRLDELLPWNWKPKPDVAVAQAA